MISSDETSFPVSASTFKYLIRWPVFLLSWLKWIFSESVVAGYRATGQVTRERRKKPFQLARGAMTWVLQNATAELAVQQQSRCEVPAATLTLDPTPRRLPRWAASSDRAF